VPVDHSDGRQLVSPFDGDDDVRPDRFYFVVLEHPPRLVDQSGRVDDYERGMRLAGKAGRPDHQRQETPDRARAADEVIGRGPHRGQIDGRDRIAQGDRRWRAEIALPDIGVDNGHFGLPRKQRPRQITTEAALADDRAADDKHCAQAALEDLGSRSLPLRRNVELATSIGDQPPPPCNPELKGNALGSANLR
jgi:hypothetical protein